MFQVFMVVFWALSASAAPKHFGESKEILARDVYPSQGKTYYCNCEYQKKSIIPKSCKLNIKGYKKRQTRLEWEHVVPIAAFGNAFKEYREAKTLCPVKGKKHLSKRKCAMKLNAEFAAMSADLHNLVPVVGAINALRSNYSFSELATDAPKLCERGFQLKDRKVSPPNEMKGDIARIYFYMDNKYPGRGVISQKNQKLFQAWDKLDPVSEAECSLNKMKGKIQGQENPFVSRSCQETSPTKQ